MNGLNQCLNTDIELISDEDLTALVAAFEAGGLDALRNEIGDDGRCFARFELDGTYEGEYAEPEETIAAMLTVVESVSPTLQAVWNNCSKREIGIGYECGQEPSPFSQALSPELLGRIAALRATLRITIYSEMDPATKPKTS